MALKPKPKATRPPSRAVQPAEPRRAARSRRTRTLYVVAEVVLVLAAFTSLSIWLTWPLVKDFGGSIYGLPGDSTGTIALLSWFADKLGYHVLGTTHVSFTGAPFGSEFPNALNIQWAALFVPGTIAAKLFGEIAAYNLLVVSGLALSGSSMYLLVRSLGALPPVAAWAGLVYTIFPWHLEKAQGHVGFVHLEGFPLLVLAVLAWHRKPTLPRALLVAASSLLLWVTAGYFGVLGSVSLGVLLPIVALFHWRRLGPRRALARLGLVASLALSVPLVVYVLTSLGSGSGIGGERSAGELLTYGARPWEYVLPSYRNETFGDDVGNYLFGHLHGSNFSETSLYVGWLTILLGTGWLVFALLRRRRLPGQHALLAVALPALVFTALVLSLPSPIPHTTVQTPSRLLWELAPQFRVPSRFIAVVMTGLVCLAALGLRELCATVARRTRHPALRGAFAGGICAAAAAISLVELPIESSPATVDVSRTPAYYTTVRAAPEGVLAEYPLARADQAVTSDYLFWQRKHGRRLVNTTQLSTFPDAVGQALADPSSPETSSALAALGVSVVVVRPNTYALTGGPSGFPRMGTGYRFLGGADGASVWRVVARPAPAIATFRTGFGATETPPGFHASRWLNADNGVVDMYAPRAGLYLARFQISSYGRRRAVKLDGRRGTKLFSLAAPRTISLPLRLPRGRSHVVLSTQPGPEPIPDGRHVSVYVANWQFQPLRGRGAPLEPFPGGAP